VIEGAAFTARRAALLAMVPAFPVTVTVKEAPLSDATAAGVM
jgi:hypothetical protein